MRIVAARLAASRGFKPKAALKPREWTAGNVVRQAPQEHSNETTKTTTSSSEPSQQGTNGEPSLSDVSSGKTRASRSTGRSIWLFAAYTATVFFSAHLIFEHSFQFGFGEGVSMMPGLTDQTLVLSMWHRRGRDIQVGDLVSFKHPVFVGVDACKRIIGMPGDFVLQDTPGQGDGNMIQVPTGHCWVVGDNLAHSRDSRIYGPIPLGLINGKIVALLDFRTWPWLKRPQGLVPADVDVDDDLD